MSLLKQSSTARALVFLMVDDTDHITGKTGLSPTVTIRKEGGSFASPAGSVTEIAHGFYQVAGNATDTGTLGSLALHATGTAADPVDVLYEVVAFDPHTAYNTIVPPTEAQMNAAFTEIKGATWSSGTDTLEIIADNSGASAGDIADAVWDELLSGHTTTGSAGDGLSAAGSAGDPWSTAIPGAYGAGTAGKIVGDNINATVSSRSTFDPAADAVANVTLVATTTTNTDMRGTDSAYTGTPPTPPTAAAISTAVWGETTRELTAFSFLTYADIADAVWDELLSGHVISGSAGDGLSAAGSAGDPWSTAIPGAYGAGTAGKIVGDNINATVSSRSTFDPAADAVANVTLVATTTTNTDMRGTDSAYTGTPPTPPTAAAISTAVWGETTRELTAFSFLTYADIADAVWDELLSGHVISGSAGDGLSAAGSGFGDTAGTTTLLARIPDTLSLTAINSEVDTALADYDAIVPADLPSNFANLLITVDGHVSRVVLNDTTTTNTDMATAAPTVVQIRQEIDANSTKLGYKLAADGLDSIAVTAPTGVATTFPQMLVQIWRRFFKRSTLTATHLKTYADDGTTVITTQIVSDDGTTQDQGVSS